jgi:PAB1-binding protein PBP1
MRFDPSGLHQAFDRMQDASKKRGKTMADQQAQFFLRELRKQGRLIAPTVETLVDVAAQLGNRLKRKKGKTVEQELKRRIRARRTFSRSWKITKIESERFRIRIWMMNFSNESGKVDDKKKTAEKAEKVVGSKFKDRLNKLTDSITSTF